MIEYLEGEKEEGMRERRRRRRSKRGREFEWKLTGRAKWVLGTSA